jgi:Flp pilus assembly protein TadD
MMEKMSVHKFYKSFAALLACALLAACQTTGTTPTGTASNNTKVDAALERAAAGAAARGETSSSLAYLEKIYKRNPADEAGAVGYARALRESDYPERAATVLAAVANSEASSAATKREYAAIQLELGNYEGAEQYAQKAILKDETDFQAFHYLGIALDAQNMHKEAERAFRKGLDLWQGDPTAIMNNLALNLAAQGYLDEASEILQKAKVVAPDRIEVERNLRIVTALQQSEKYKAPKPDKKPAAAASGTTVQ